MTVPMQDQERGSGASKRRPEPRYLAIGRVVRPFGLRGELKVELMTDYPEQLNRLHTVYVGPKAIPRQVEGVRLHRGAALFKLVGCDDRPDADALRGALVQIDRQEAVPLETDEYYEHQIIDLTVVEQDGTYLGKITDIIHTGANEVIVVVGPEGELLLPFIEPVVLDIDLDADRITVHVLEGLR